MSSNTYSDAIHLRAIRKALANRNAAVMVGSGFSRNAEGGQNVGTWEDLAEALARGLNPSSEKVVFNAANATQLAEQYERLFSRPALEQVLRQVVPDERLAPGRLHIALMSMPWSEVLTTNYDTLLERTAETLLESSYFTICCREDIPQSRILGRRRIVKLHGSFASHRPFIVTEEDYRKYPNDSAPFVNLVRQSLLENVLCLIGFSGDDPNFLHWIGWVRDMQDQHALPIYLLLSKEATAGQRALLQARGVTPVLLPPSASGEDSDYEGRYLRLFEMLNEPLEGSISGWGKIEWSDTHRQYRESVDERYGQFIEALPLIAAQRASYPGWLVAPQRIRRRFANHLQGAGHWFDQIAYLKKLEEEEPAVALATLGLYAWAQSILLEDLDDQAAQTSLRVLHKTANLKFSQIKHLEKRLRPFGFTNQNALAEGWTKLALAILSWARQGHHSADYKEIEALLIEWRPEDLVVNDHLAYQAVLSQLHEGNRGEALRRLGRWRVQGSDVYMQIRHAVLVAEMGRVTEALSSCEKAVQLMRQQQRLDPDDPLLLSMESWACLITMQIHESVEQLSLFGMSVDSGDDADEQRDVKPTKAPATSQARHSLGDMFLARDSQDKSVKPNSEGASGKENRERLRSDEFNDRLRALGKKGYDSEDELRRIIERLNEDAGDPTAKNSPYSSFELYARPQSRIVGLGSEHRNKVTAAQTWLQLAERVGLTPMVGKTRFYTEEFLQAAWWIRDVEKDPLRRGVGVLFRCVHADALKSRDRTRPPHKTGWLSRLQVASLDSSYAETHAERFLSRLELLASSPRTIANASREFDFFATSFSRIVIRVESQEKVFEWANRLLELHTTRGLLGASDKWRIVGQALVQCMEALDTPWQQRVLFRLFQLPHKAPSDEKRHGDNWLSVQPLLAAMRRDNNGVANDLDWNPMFEELLRELSEAGPEVSPNAWLRLFALDILKRISADQRRAVGALLWRGHDGKKLPVVPGFYPHATLRWPAPNGVDADTVYKRFWLEQEFVPFSSTEGYMTLKAAGGRTYRLPLNDGLLQGVKLSMGRAAWSESDLSKFFSIIEKWLDLGIDNLNEDMRSHSELQAGVTKLLQILDEILSLVFLGRGKQRDGHADKVLTARVWPIYDRLQIFRMPMWRLKLLKAASSPDPQQLVACVGELELAMVSRDLFTASSAHAIAGWALNISTQGDLPSLDSLYDRLVSTVSSRVMPSFSSALDVLATQPSPVWKKYLSLPRLFLLNGTLASLQEELKVDGHGRCEEIDEEAVPLLRFRCAELAFAITLHSRYSTPAALDWLEQAKKDPLPELRLRAFEDRVAESD